MKLSNFCLAALIGAGALGAFADAANTLISFSTMAPSATYQGDTYADGKQVLDGEWYALVWSKDGNFGGITTTCEPARAGDAVVLVAPLAKGGCCPFTVFQIDSKSADAHADGVYAVYLLDTRSADGQTVAAKTTAGLPSLMNGSVETAKYAATSLGGTSAQTPSTSSAWGESVVADAKQPTIKAFKVDGNRVTITVGDLMPGVKYNVQMGETVDNLKDFALEVPQMPSASTVDFNLVKPSGKFFRVVREPLVK